MIVQTKFAKKSFYKEARHFVVYYYYYYYKWPLFKDNLGKPAPERQNHFGFQ